MVSCAVAEGADGQRVCGIGEKIAFDLQNEASALNLPSKNHRIDPVQTARGQFDHASLARGLALLLDVFFQTLDTPR
jgi:hypothetical protein